MGCFSNHSSLTKLLQLLKMEEIETVDKVVSTYKSDFSLPKGLWRHAAGKTAKGSPSQIGSCSILNPVDPIPGWNRNKIWVSPDHIKSGQVWLDPILVIVLNIDQIET